MGTMERSGPRQPGILFGGPLLLLLLLLLCTPRGQAIDEHLHTSWPVWSSGVMPGASQLAAVAAAGRRPAQVRNDAPYNVLKMHHRNQHTTWAGTHGQARARARPPPPKQRGVFPLERQGLNSAQTKETHTHCGKRTGVEYVPQSSIAVRGHRLGRSADIGLHPPPWTGQQARVLKYWDVAAAQMCHPAGATYIVRGD